MPNHSRDNSRTAAFAAGLVSLALAGLAFPAFSDAPSGRALLPEAEQDEWLAIGRLNVAPAQGHCTATLIAPDVVLTAAHCVTNPLNNRPYAVGKLHFLAGFRQSAFAHHGRVVKVEIAEGFLQGGQAMQRDLALVHLDAPVAEHIAPIPLAPPSTLVGFSQVDVFSYGRDHAFIVSVQRDCDILSRHSTVLKTNCEAVPGVSGAPLILEGASGPSLAGLIVGANSSDMPLNPGPGAAAVIVDPIAFDALLGDL
ncbi:MAG: S1 family peptidase [Rhodobacteraceae bacterium]|nr:S1 family peptidase [Paracoccaceae bacterium]